MLIFVIVGAVAGWLVLWAVLARRNDPPAGFSAAPASVEPPAVVSLLAGRLGSDGYPATLLDLAARGWFRLETRAGGPAMCVLGQDRPVTGLTAYERLAYENLVARAGARRDVPAGALSDGFAGPLVSDGAVKSAKDSFMAAFTRDVIEDSRARGLSRPRLSESAGCLLWVVALVPAAASALALHAYRNHAYWIPVVGFIALCALSGIAVKHEKPTPAGQAAVRAWRVRCARSAPVPSTVATGWPDRQVAYAAALGRARAAVRLFSKSPGKPSGKAIWSGYGGSWRWVTIGNARPRSWLEAGGPLLGILTLVLLALLPPTIAGVLLSHGELRAALFGVMACDAGLVAVLIMRDAAVPRFAEFDGQVVEAWIEEVSDENTSTTYLCLAIDDGVRDQAWALSVSRAQYTTFTPGTLVRVQVNPRRNTLLALAPG